MFGAAAAASSPFGKESSRRPLIPFVYIDDDNWPEAAIRRNPVDRAFREGGVLPSVCSPPALGASRVCLESGLALRYLSGGELATTRELLNFLTILEPLC